jgi:hypothetical protein
VFGKSAIRWIQSKESSRAPRKGSRKVDHNTFRSDVEAEIADGRTKSQAIKTVAQRYEISTRAGWDIMKDLPK